MRRSAEDDESSGVNIFAVLCAIAFLLTTPFLVLAGVLLGVLFLALLPICLLIDFLVQKVRELGGWIMSDEW